MAVAVVRLLVLGVVRSRGRTHGYAVQRALRDWRIETWTRVQPGSLYHALKQLTKEGKLRDVGVEQTREGPGRTLYELTGEGERELNALLEDALTSIDPEELGAGVAFMQALPRRRVLELLGEQRRLASRTVENLERLLPQFPDRSSPPHTQDLLLLWRGGVSSIAAWTSGLIERVESGEYVFADDPIAPPREAGKP